MSMITCSLCQSLIDSDEDPDGLYTLPAGKHDFVCRSCRDEHSIDTEFDQEEARDE